MSAVVLTAVACQPVAARHGPALAPDEFRVRVETTKGAFVIAVHRAWAPHGADRLFQLVGVKYFDDSRFFRVRAGYIAQFGIAGNAGVAMLWLDSTILDDSAHHSNTRGTVAFATTGPETRTTQLFVNLANNPQLDRQGFAPLGEVVEGMDVADKLFADYGENSGGAMRPGGQRPLYEEGNPYTDTHFPLLDRLLRARIVDAK